MSGQYGVLIKDYLPNNLHITSDFSGYMNHEVTYGGEEDSCFLQFIESSTGPYYQLMDDTFQ